MGDGGVACVASQHIMERFPICGGNTNGGSSSTTTNTNSNSNTNITSSKLSSSGKNGKIMKKVKRIIKRRKVPVLKNSVDNGKEVLVNNSNTTDGDVNKDEVEEGELGTLPIENGEFIAERATTTTTPRKYELKSEIEKGEVVEEKWRNDDGKVEKDQFNFSGKWRKPEGAEKTGYNSGHWKVSSKEELDKGEYFPERRRKSEVVKDDYVYPRARRHDSVKDNGWKGDGGCTEAPSQHSQSSGKYPNVKELSRSGKNNFSRYDGNVLDKSPRISSKIVDDVWTESSDGKVHSREYNSLNRFKRQAAAEDTSDWNHRGDSDDYMSSKVRKVSDKGALTVHSSEHYARHSTERSHRNVSFSSKNVSFSSKNVYSDKYSSRHVKSSSKVTYDKGSSSPRHSGRPPHDRAHHYDHRDRSPVHFDPNSRYDLSRSPNERNHGYGYSRSPHGRSHPYSRSRSPYDRSRHVDNRKGSPSCSAWSPQNQSGYHDSRMQTPSFLEQSPAHGRLQDTDRKSGGWEKKKISGGNRGSDGKPKQQKNQTEQDFRSSVEESEPRCKSDANHDLRTENDDAILKEEIIPDSDANTSEKKPEAPRDSGSTEELASMEEDMDICNTPPHDPLFPDAIPANWFYLDHIGEEQGPSGLSDLKKLVEQGILTSDHLIKHSGSDRWVTVENAVSPLVTVSFPSIVSDTVTELVSPPEAPGNLLVDSEVSDSCHPMPFSLDSTSYHEGCLASDTLKDFYIEERVEALLEGLTISPGRELEIVGEALQMTFVNVEWEKWGITEADFHDQICSKAASESLSEETKEVKSTILLPFEKDIALDHASDEGFSGLWSCKGGDWKRNDEDLLDIPWKRKVVLNDGYPLCQMEKCLYEDPRLQQKDELYYTSHGQKFDLPGWTFTSPDEWNDSGGASRSALSKIHNVRGVCGMMLPVVRINACVIKDHESFGSEQRVKARGKDIYSSRSSRNYSVSSDRKRSSEEGYSHPKGTYEQDSRGSWKSSISPSFSVPKDHICTVDELNLHLGDWYYFDGAGHERGPSLFSEFQALAEQGAIPKNSSIYRKVDKIWVPVFSVAEVSIPGERTQQVRNDSAAEISGKSLSGLYENTLDERSNVSGAFHSLHPHFIGYTRGKLHELVMKSYKSREFAAAINEVLDPWINTRLPKKEMDRHISGSVLFQKSDQLRAGKRFGIYEIDESAMDDISGSTQGDWSFDKLCSDAMFRQELGAVSKTERGNWGQMDGCVLARVFHFLRADIRSLVNVALTCKLWRYIVSCYKDASRQVDLSSLATNCNDTIIWNIMNGYDREKVCSLILRGCTSITFSMLEEVLKSFHNLAFVDIRGCNQFEELADRFPNITWIRNRGTELKIRSVKHLSEKQLDDSSGLRDYLENADRRDSAKQLLQQSLYKRSKLFDARKSSSILSRDANLSRFAMRKSNIAYKRMEDFLDLSIKDIMKENTFEFFVPKVAKIEDRMRSGYYAKRGLSSVKEDIMQMCRDAIKKKNRSDVSGINRIVTLFFRLATYLEGGSKSAFDRDEIMKTWKDESPPGFPSVSSKYKKNYSKANDKKSIIRNNGSSFINNISDYGDYVSDREIRTCLSKLHKKLVDSGSETSDDVDRSSDEGMTDSEITDSNTASDSDLRSEGGTGESRLDAYSPDEGFDSFTDEREWGARMTKASLVPPVARKYEVIDHYVVVADEEEVRRKMRVSLPEDYAEKLTAQRSGNDESDMQIPEVKDYKPRKCLGIEVIEQEVYGIDPYTHNLLLDSLPEELEWSPQDMHVFIENVLPRTLNKQVRHFTGSGSTPMTYPLKSVFEEILETAEENNDWRTLKLSKCILKAIDSRPEDNYVAYRKGLGVVCNKEGGFSEDDFVVEFLGEVYPTWKWFEKQDGIRSLQKNSKDPAPEFYNIYLERPKGDADGYDLVVVDAMHKANYASRICHSCRPNSEAKVTAVEGQYQIGIYSVRPIQYGEEITFDYNSVTESKEEYEASVCLCGSHVCRGSFLNLTGEGAYLKVLKEYHGILDRQRLILEACELNSFSDEDYIDLLKAGLGKCLLDGLPDWLVAYSAHLVRFINFERSKLPKEILKHNLEEKKKYFADISLEVEKSDAEVQAEGVYNQRLQNLALTLDKVRYVMRCVFGDPKKAPPPLERLSPQEAASYIWSGEGSLVDELVQCMTPHMESSMLRELQAQIRAHDPSGASNIEMELHKSLIWLRDEVRNLPCSYKCRNDAAADLIHVYAYTKSYFRIREYKPVTSPPVYISSLDLCPKYADKLGSDGHEYCKTYGENYCLGQLVYWYNQANADPDGNLARASRGCLSLPDIGSFYAKVQKPSRQRVYGPRTVKFMLSRMEKQSQRAWPKDRIWTFKTNPKIVGSPMLDAVLNKAPLDKEMLHWLKHRIPIYQAQWDR